MAHKFNNGQRVQYASGSANAHRPFAVRFTVVKQMPAGVEGPAYRIKGDGETHERIALETHLEAIF